MSTNQSGLQASVVGHRMEIRLAAKAWEEIEPIVQWMLKEGMLTRAFERRSSSSLSGTTETFVLPGKDAWRLLVRLGELGYEIGGEL